jgi:hypothetical protein
VAVVLSGDQPRVNDATVSGRDASGSRVYPEWSGWSNRSVWQTFLCHRTATMAAELDEAVAAIRTAH